ncbi:hypothetical protein CK203_009781 [Vitis vinifera]|uniref:Uncharacterized protein n=1 Tax=Vitis vinifera TaxID=29760 RepID=A0A438JVS6_VITVI|nr:hypothetical protein CK203_076098 [Vitis vinifera]RVX13035.1 hypothetical protein CK203_009781 [Vitis vinifera]
MPKGYKSYFLCTWHEYTWKDVNKVVFLHGKLYTCQDVFSKYKLFTDPLPPFAGQRHHFESTPQKGLHQLTELNSVSLPSNPLHGRQNEADLSFSTSLTQSQDRDENAFCSLSSEMEIEESPH